MKKGAVAILDFLGTKGIWKKHAAEIVLENAGFLQQGVVETHINTGRYYLKRQYENGAPNIKLESKFFSDTIFLFCWCDVEDSTTTICPLVYILGKIVANLIREAVLIKPPRTLRGCISIGAFEFNNNNAIGEAIDEAGVSHDSADGAFVFLTQSAQNCLSEAVSLQGFLNEEEIKLFVAHEVFIKNDSMRVVPIVNPLVGESKQEQITIINRTIESFDSDDDSVQRKKKKTEKFLVKCMNL